MPTPSTVIISVPKIELSKPPPVSPGGGVISVKTSIDKCGNPFESNEKRIRKSQEIPMAVARRHKVIAVKLERRRLA
jgi:hypothetical protein